MELVFALGLLVAFYYFVTRTAEDAAIRNIEDYNG